MKKLCIYVFSFERGLPVFGKQFDALVRIVSDVASNPFFLDSSDLDGCPWNKLFQLFEDILFFLDFVCSFPLWFCSSVRSIETFSLATVSARFFKASIFGLELQSC